LKKYRGIRGWRKIGHWRGEIKGLMRELGKANSSGGKNKAGKVTLAAENYLEKARLLMEKLRREVPGFPIGDTGDLALVMALEYFMGLLEKHIDLVDRRILKGEKYPTRKNVFHL
jgi:hypothetical protein